MYSTNNKDGTTTKLADPLSNKESSPESKTVETNQNTTEKEKGDIQGNFTDGKADEYFDSIDRQIDDYLDSIEEEDSYLDEYMEGYGMTVEEYERQIQLESVYDREE